MRSGEMKADGRILWDGGNTHSVFVEDNPWYSLHEGVLEAGTRVVATETKGGVWEVKPETPKAPKPRHKRPKK